MKNKWIALILATGMMIPTFTQAEVVEESIQNILINDITDSKDCYSSKINDEEIDDEEIDYNTGIMLIFTDINEISTSINISAGGIATVNGSTSAILAEGVETIVRLQQFCDNKWKTLYTWSSKEEGFSMIQKSRAVKKGYSYRTQVTGKAYNKGKVTEEVTVNSQSKYY